MSASSTARVIRQTARSAVRSFGRPVQTTPVRSSPLRQKVQKKVATTPILLHPRWLSGSRAAPVGLMPDSEDPQPPQEDPVAAEPIATQPAPISDDEYHDLADEYLDTVVNKAEELQEGREDVEVDYSAGVLSITFPPNGTYIINKQPPNKQIWLSSPLSGPKRYDWVVVGEGMDEKEGGGSGGWVYLRDGTNLTSLLQKELGLNVDPHEEPLEASKDLTE